MTIQDLKNNRTEIIETLIVLFGETNLKSAMNMMKDAAEYSQMFNDGKTIKEAIQDIEDNSDVFENRKMRLADYIASLNNHSSEQQLPTSLK